MGQKITVVDAFTEEPFAGNPAAVCLLDEARTEVWMQRLAREMNHSETAFLVRDGEAWSLRWFTPECEVDLCGHATLAGAHVLWESGIAGPEETLHFKTRSGALSARRHVGWIELDLPATPAAPIEAPDLLGTALGAPLRWVGETVFDLLAEVENEATVRGLRPNVHALGGFPSRGVIVTGKADTGKPYDFVSRYFAPTFGIPEDPVTGSAHCALGPFWEERLGKKDLVGYQASPRGGTVRVRVNGDRARIGGRAVTVLRGELAIP